MARSLRIEFPGAIYHITSRGNARQFIFLDEKGKNNFLEIQATVTERFNWLCHAYCLMGNHYHLIIETPEGNLSRGMRQLNGVYTQIFNRQHNRVGHLFQGRYKAILVDRESYLLSLCRYVVLNPVRAGLVKSPEEWKWSSYQATAGEVEKPSFLTVDWILAEFGSNNTSRKRQYKQFVMDGMKEEFSWKDMKGQILLGTDSFVENMSEFLKDTEMLKEIPKVQRYATRPPLEELFSMEKHRVKKGRDETIYSAYVHYGYKLREIAEFLRVHYATISRAIQRVEGRGDKM